MAGTQAGTGTSARTRTRAREEPVEVVVERRLREEGNAALQRATQAAFIPAVGGFLGIPILHLTGRAGGLGVPWAFTGLCFVYCLLLYRLARARRVHGALAWAVLLPFGSLPTFFFLATHIVERSGVATFVNGPLSLLYFLVVAVTACVFDHRITAASGALAALGYLACVALGMPELTRIQHPDPLLRQDLVTFPIYAFKAMMIVGSAVLLGALSLVGRRLALRVLGEERQKHELSRLFGQYVSEEVKERLLQDASRFTGERTTVVILFSDLRGFTTYSERARPEEIVATLNRYFDEMVDAITENGGVIDKFIGDAVMATFDGVLAIDEPAAAAVRAALEMRRRLVKLNETWADTGLRLDNGVGLHLGEVVMGSIGSEDRKDFTVIGDAVNLASRVEGATKAIGHAVALTEAVYTALPPDLRAACVDTGLQSLKGKSEAVRLFGLEPLGSLDAPDSRELTSR